MVLSSALSWTQIVLSICLSLQCLIGMAMLYQRRHIGAVKWRDHRRIYMRMAPLFICQNIALTAAVLPESHSTCSMASTCVVSLQIFMSTLLLQHLHWYKAMAKVQNILSAVPTIAPVPMAAAKPTLISKLRSFLNRYVHDFLKEMLLICVLSVASSFPILYSSASSHQGVYPSCHTTFSWAWESAIITIYTCILMYMFMRIRGLHDAYYLRLEWMGSQAMLALLCLTHWLGPIVRHTISSTYQTWMDFLAIVIFTQGVLCASVWLPLMKSKIPQGSTKSGLLRRQSSRNLLQRQNSFLQHFSPRSRHGFESFVEQDSMDTTDENHNRSTNSRAEPLEDNGTGNNVSPRHSRRLKKRPSFRVDKVFRKTLLSENCFAALKEFCASEFSVCFSHHASSSIQSMSPISSIGKKTPSHAYEISIFRASD